MARRLEVEIVGDARSLERAFGRAGGASNSLGNQFKRLAKLGGAAVLGGLAAGGIASIKAASDLGEQINKTMVVFRGSEKTVLAWGETTAKTFGISNRAALEAAGTFGNMLVPMGFARQEAGKMSMRMVELAADMASFNNASPEQVLEALRSGLAGETEPLRQFGVFLNDARLKQEALNLGLYDGTGALSASAKAAATYAVILKDTGDSQGDFSRTSGSLANQSRLLKAQLEDLAAKIGERLLPMAVKLAAFLLNDLIPAVETFGRVVELTWSTISDAWAGDTASILSLIGKFLRAMEFTANALGKMPGPFGEPFRAAAKAIGLAVNRVEALQESVEKLKSKNIQINAAVTGLGSVAALAEHLDLINRSGGNVTASQRTAVAGRVLAPAGGGGFSRPALAGASGGGAPMTINLVWEGRILARAVLSEFDRLGRRNVTTGLR